uniref:hypothetical protein n=1 Tax=Streptomyces sp. F2 TaxID=317660 RepID=UPI0015E86E62|nr:hypothetical protein [Streptomyces sp. F2]
MATYEVDHLVPGLQKACGLVAGSFNGDRRPVIRQLVDPIHGPLAARYVHRYVASTLDLYDRSVDH